MARPQLLWIDLTRGGTDTSLLDAIGQLCAVQMTEHIADLENLLAAARTDVLCCDIDKPTQIQRALLQRLKQDFPAIPILLFTRAHSTELVMWALRTRVWDCFIKPVRNDDVVHRMSILISTLTPGRRQRARRIYMPLPRHGTTAPGEQARTEQALRYLNRNYRERVPLADAAELCGMSIFEFSRTFKREQGMTFRDYTLQLRIQAAAQALCSTDTSILDVAFSVGFNDPSHFSRLFRRTMGVTPSTYRRSFSTSLATPPPD